MPLGIRTTGSLDGTEQLLNHTNCWIGFFFKEEVAVKSYIWSLSSNMEKKFTCFVMHQSELFTGVCCT